MAKGIERYGLAESPFTVERIVPYTSEVAAPGGMPAQQKLRPVIEVDGFSKIAEIEARVKAAVDAGTPAHFLIVGKRGSGTSFLAKYILDRYRDLRLISDSRFVVPSPQQMNHDPVSVMHLWLG